MADRPSGNRGPTAFEMARRIAGMLAAAFAAESPRNPRAALANLARAAHADADARIVHAAEPAACAPGCAYCCHHQVSATAPEILVIATRIAALKPPARARRRAAIRRALAATADLLPAERWILRHPCPLLDDDRLCSVYEDRPFGCRGYASRDLGACRAAFDAPEERGPATIPRPESTRLSAVMLSAALDQALGAHGLPPHPYDLIHGLEIALDLGPAAATGRYLAGEDVFAPARILPPREARRPDARDTPDTPGGA